MTDPISDMLARIRNAQGGRKGEVRIPFSRIKLEVIKLLHREGYVGAYKATVQEGSRKWIEVGLRYDQKGLPIVSSLRRVSRPGRRGYVGHQKIPLVRSGMGLTILSTSRGLLTDREARREKVGGEILCVVD